MVFTSHQVAIPARDIAGGSFIIQATHLQPTNYTGASPVILSSATGVPCGFYLPFATHLADQLGIPVLLFDYRFVGRSFPAGAVSRDDKIEALKTGSHVSIAREWKWDFEAALAWIIAIHPGRKVVSVGHSVGGMALVSTI